LNVKKPPASLPRLKRLPESIKGCGVRLSVLATCALAFCSYGVSQELDLVKTEQDIQAVIERVRPAVVSVFASRESEPNTGASGVIVSPDGLVLCQFHISHALDSNFERTRPAGSRTKVILDDQREIEAELLGANRVYDISLLKLPGPGPYPFVDLERSELKTGDFVIKLGHPNAYQVNRPAVSRFGRVLATNGETFVADCNIAGGDSGGPYFDLQGRLVGIIYNNPVPMNLTMAARRAERAPFALFKANSVGTIQKAWQSMLEKNVTEPDYAEWMRIESRLAQAEILPTESWSQGINSKNPWKNRLESVRTRCVQLCDSNGQWISMGTVIRKGLVVSIASNFGTVGSVEGVQIQLDHLAIPCNIQGVMPEYDLVWLAYDGELPNKVESPGVRTRSLESGTLLAAVGNQELPLATGIVSSSERSPKGPFPDDIVWPFLSPAAPPEIIGSEVSGRGYWVEFAEGNAANSGICPGDLIESISGQAIRQTSDLQDVVSNLNEGAAVSVQLVRNGNRNSLTLTLPGIAPRSESPRFTNFPTFFEHDMLLTPKECGSPLADLNGEFSGITLSRGSYGCAALSDSALKNLLQRFDAEDFVQGWTPRKIAPKKETRVEAPFEPSPESVSISLDELREHIKARAENLPDLQIEYHVSSDLHVAPDILTALDFRDAREMDQDFRVAYSGKRLAVDVLGARLQWLPSPLDQLKPLANAPPRISKTLANVAEEARVSKNRGEFSYLIRGLGAPQQSWRNDGDHTYLWSGNWQTLPNEFMQVPDYLASLGIQPTSIGYAEYAQLYDFRRLMEVAGSQQISGKLSMVDEQDCVLWSGKVALDNQGTASGADMSIWFDPAIGYAPRYLELRLDGNLTETRKNTRFRQLSSGTWLPMTSVRTFYCPSWASEGNRDTKAYSQLMIVNFAIDKTDPAMFEHEAKPNEWKTK
jgi:serine protease Do